MCSASSVEPAQVASGLGAWGWPDGGAEVAFERHPLSIQELKALTNKAEFIMTNGAGFGICKGCRTGTINR